MAEEENNGDMTSVDVQRILKENKERRAPKMHYLGLESDKSWKVEGFVSKGTNIYLDEARLPHAVLLLRNEEATITIPHKVAHVSAQHLHQCTVRITSVVTTVELIHCSNIKLVCKGSVPVIEIDMCKNIEIHLKSTSRPKIVNSSNSGLSVVVEDEAEPLPLETSIMGEQFVAYWDSAGRMQTKAASSLKDSVEGKYLTLAGISGSNADLKGMEAAAAQVPPAAADATPKADLLIVGTSAPSRTVRPIWLLEELNVPYEYEAINNLGGEGRSEAWLQEHPQFNGDPYWKGCVPGLYDRRDGGFVLTESFAILNYLCAREGRSDLMPLDGTRQRALYDRAAFFVATELDAPLWAVALHKFVAAEEKRIPEAIAFNQERYLRSVFQLDAVLARQRYLLGDSFSAVDIPAGHFLWLGQLWNMLPESATNVHEYLLRLKARPAFIKMTEILK